jgi:predicted thioesterase
VPEDDLSNRPPAQLRFTVGDVDTASALGSGDVDVLGTPRLLAWLEAATVRAAASALEPGQTSVGTAVRLRHRRPSRVGDWVEVSARPVGERNRPRLTFVVRAVDGSGELVADGEVDRVVVDREGFGAR